MYAMICTRPDISHTVNVISRYISNPDKEYWLAVKWIFRYLWGTSDVCLEFVKHGSSIVGFVDYDFAWDLDKRRSITGYVFALSRYTISWKASLQPIVALSTTKASTLQWHKLLKKLFEG